MEEGNVKLFRSMNKASNKKARDKTVSAISVMAEVAKSLRGISLPNNTSRYIEPLEVYVRDPSQRTYEQFKEQIQTIESQLKDVDLSCANDTVNRLITRPQHLQSQQYPTYCILKVKGVEQMEKSDHSNEIHALLSTSSIHAISDFGPCGNDQRHTLYLTDLDAQAIVKDFILKSLRLAVVFAYVTERSTWIFQKSQKCKYN